jgi:cell wall-associated NlpC family hydrolase
MLLVGLLLAIPACRSGKSNGSGKPRSGWFSRVFGGGSKSKKETVYSQKYGKKEIDKVIQTARSYRGTPHRDGGVNRYGIDCSALMMLSFESAGLKIPRTARQQAELGKPVQKTELRPGDLVFFADRKIGSGITHVGLVTEITAKGEVQFIHTSSKLGVTENLLSTSYFTRTYAKAVRPF